jgi:hypothetical protein
VSGGYGYPPQPPVAVSRLVAAALLVLAAALAVGGSFAALSVYRFESDFTPATTTTTTGWGEVQDPVSEQPLPTVVFLYGIPLAVAAVVVLVAAVLLALSTRRPDDPPSGRLLGVGGAGMLVGVVSVVWLELVAISRNVARTAEPEDGIESSYQVGFGGYLILVAAIAALVAALLLLVPRRGTGAPPFGPPGTGSFPPLGPGPYPPQWAAPPQPWPPPDAPPPGWGPPQAPPPHQG